jgi:hypothetical protein
MQYQHSATNVLHFLFNLLRIKGIYMFRALLAHPQEAIHKRHLVYCVRLITVGYTKMGGFHSNPGAAKWHNKHTIYQVPFV